MLMLKNHDVTNPMATVPMIAIGIIFSGLGTSSAMCVAQSRQAKGPIVIDEANNERNPVLTPASAVDEGREDKAG